MKSSLPGVLVLLASIAGLSVMSDCAAAGGGFA